MVEETIVDANLNEKMIIWKQEQSLDQNLGYREFINLLKMFLSYRSQLINFQEQIICLVFA